tara:strand:- start:308 stop:667 length:360 start_codon:yes stop_codon:yes gene_type:complete
MKTFKYIERQERPWGVFFTIHDQNNYKIKRLEIYPGKRLSYQYHKKRSESWIIIEGSPIITIDDSVKRFNEGETLVIKNEVKHRIENSGNKKVIIIEVQTGTYFGEDDIIRLEDDYNRI